VSKSAFAQLLEEAQHLLHRRARRPVRLDFAWNGTEQPGAWSCWYEEVTQLPTPKVYFGMSGEQALRNMVEALRG